MGLKPINLCFDCRRRYRKRLATLTAYQLSVLVSMLHLVNDGFDLSDLDGLPALLESVLEEPVHGPEHTDYDSEDADDDDDDDPSDPIDAQFFEELRKLDPTSTQPYREPKG